MRVESLTFFRFIAAFIVVIFHFGVGTWFTKTFGRFVTAGPEMVSFFFVLSGFVMIISQINKVNFCTKKYYYGRIARIFPVYLIGLLIILPFKYYINPISHNTSLFLSVTFLQSWVSPYALSFNSPGWSVSVEMFFYATFPMILFLIKKIKPKPDNFILFSIFVWAFTQYILINLLNSKFYQGFLTTSHDLIYYFPLSHFCSFLIGISVAYFFINSNFQKSLSNVKASIFLNIVVLFLLYFCITKEPFLKDYFKLNLPFGSSFYAPVFALVILVIAASKNIITKILSIKPFIFLGNISFSIYILHSPLHTFYKEFIMPYFKEYEFNKTQIFLFFILLLLISCTLIYYIIEKPIQNFLMKNYDRILRKYKEFNSPNQFNKES
jgi:peptidoglycan/LPS O-acetylase OafA/YrhL